MNSNGDSRVLPPPPGFAPAPPVTVQPGQQVVVIQQMSFGHEPMGMTCTHCNAQIITEVKHEATGKTWLYCCILSAVGCNLGCCLLPFCMDSTQEARHSCPNCQSFLGASH